METTLHQQLKEYYCKPGCEIEVKMGRYRIDVVDGNRLIEIQHSGLAAIRSKIADLITGHSVDVVKPIVVRKKLIKLTRKNGQVASSRMSPKRGGFLDLIDELLYFTRVFPHPNLRLIVPMIEVEETRYPGHGRRRRKRAGDFVVADRILTNIITTKTYCTAQDLNRELPSFRKPFDTGALAKSMSIQRWQAQRIAYVLRKTGSIEQVGKNGNALLYKKVGRTIKRKPKMTNVVGKKPKRGKSKVA